MPSAPLPYSIELVSVTLSESRNSKPPSAEILRIGFKTGHGVVAEGQVRKIDGAVALLDHHAADQVIARADGSAVEILKAGIEVRAVAQVVIERNVVVCGHVVAEGVDAGGRPLQ